MKKCPTVRDRDPIEPRFFNVIFRELERLSKARGIGGLRVQWDRADGPLFDGGGTGGGGGEPVKVRTPAAGIAVGATGTCTTIDGGIEIEVTNPFEASGCPGGVIAWITYTTQELIDWDCP